ncbi:unnamed protein product [Oppiella nova]|uniref:EamA domain-containing protein n=1 Tax=Oppiella nova TaxID=334625 RepID=A0A7R9M3S6_9ACAR|nr:unnamed protein product [Oppiella nova]CAG2170137.1 unnamed protein product [Oppiella nova]
MHLIVVKETNQDSGDTIDSPSTTPPHHHRQHSSGCPGTPLEFSVECGCGRKISDGSYPTLATGLPVPYPVYKKHHAKSLPEMIPAFGIMMSILSVIAFSVASVIVKIITDLHSLQVLFIRCTFQLIFYIVPVIYHRHNVFGVPGHRIDLFLRAICGTSAAIFIYQAYRLIPLGDATTIQFSSPVIVIFLAVFILKEPLTWLQGCTGIITFVGVIVIAKPEFIFGTDTYATNDRTQGLIFSVVAALSTASVMLILRKLRTTPLPVVIIWFSGVAMAASLTTVLIVDKWVWPRGWYQYGLLVGIGILGIADQFFMTIALHYESAGPVAITRTLNIVLAFVWDVLLLDEESDWTSIVGAVLVTVCIALLGVSKWRQEKPDQFDRCRRRLCCCCIQDSVDMYAVDEEQDVLIIRKQSTTAFYDSIDDKGLTTGPIHTKPMSRNESFTGGAVQANKEVVVVEKNS